MQPPSPSRSARAIEVDLGDGVALPPPSMLGDANPARRAFHLFLAITALTGVMCRLVGYFLPIYFKELGFSGVQTGLYFTVTSLATLILSLPMGVTTDRKSIAGILMFSTGLTAFSYLGLIFTKSFAVFCLFAFIGSFGGRFYSTATNSLFFKISDSRSGRDAGLYQLVSFASTGVGMWLGSLIIAAFSFRTVFVAACVGNIVIAALSYYLPRTETVSLSFTEYRKEVFTPRVLFITAIFTLSSLHWGAETVSYGPFLRDVLGLSIRMTGLYTAAGYVFVGLGAYLGVILLRRGVFKDLQAVLMIGFILGGLGHILMCVRNPWLSFGMRAIHETGDGLVFLAYYHGIAKIFRINTIGGCAAFMSLWMGLGSMGSSVLFGWVGDHYGHQWSLITSGAIMVLLPGLLMLSTHKISQPAEEEAPA